MIVPIVHPSNPVKNLTMDQIKAIYDGSIRNWKELGGKDDKIVVISRDTSSGTYEIWHEKVMKKVDVRNDALLQASNGAIVTTVAGNPKVNRVCRVRIHKRYSQGNHRQRRSRSPSTTANQVNFPISRKLYMYINEKKLSDQSKKFIDYLLGKEGQGLVKEAGYIPL